MKVVPPSQPPSATDMIEALASDVHMRSCLSGRGEVGGTREARRDSRLAFSHKIKVGIWNVGAAAEGYVGAHGGFSYIVRNGEGRSILDFATVHDLVVVNTFFKKIDHHLITFQSGGLCTKINYLLVRRGDFRTCKDCRVFLGETCSSQHRILSLDTLFEIVQRRRERNVMLKVLSSSDADCMWNTLECIIKDAAKETLGVAIRTSKTYTANRESWGNQEDRIRAHEKYKKAKREAKKAVAQAKDKAYEDLYKKLDSKKGENDIFRIAKARERYRFSFSHILKSYKTYIFTCEEKCVAMATTTIGPPMVVCVIVTWCSGGSIQRYSSGLDGGDPTVQ
nr:hypothetical protein [Tanacetum cinerariifolium]